MGESGNIGMLGQRQVTPKWADDPVRRHGGRRWRGCWGRGGFPPQKDVRRHEGRAGRDKCKYVTISNMA